MTIEWTTEYVTIKDLKEYPHNPRKITKKEFDKLVRSIKEDGYHQRIVVDTENVIIGGHQRKKALLAAGFKESDTIEVLMPNRPLLAEEFDRVNIRDNLPFGMFDFDILSSRFDLDKLAEFGMDEDMIIGFDGGDKDDSATTTKDDEESECDCQCCRH
jgi:site-specific DNA-methyltransferase (adenine-specific)